MTGLIGFLRTLGLTALTAGGVLMAQTGFDGGFVDNGSQAGMGSEAWLSNDDARSALIANASASFEADTIADGGNECAVNCLAPCANGCIAPASLSGEAELEAGSAAFAPEHLCGCSDGGTTGLDIAAEVEAGFEADVSSQDNADSIGADGSLAADAGLESGATNVLLPSN